jgi:hypothetical protein
LSRPPEYSNARIGAVADTIPPRPEQVSVYVVSWLTVTDVLPEGATEPTAGEMEQPAAFVDVQLSCDERGGGTTTRSGKAVNVMMEGGG